MKDHPPFFDPKRTTPEKIKEMKEINDHVTALREKICQKQANGTL